MKEKVKVWIADKGLTADSYDSIMIGVIYNSGHNTLDDPDVRKWIETHPGEFRGMLPPKLTDDQQVVLDWLKKRYVGDADPFGVTASLFSQTPRSEVIISSLKLTKIEQAQVLQAFASWALEQE